MTAYLFADIEVTDPALFADYRRDTPAIVAAHGGQYLVRGGDIEVLEGDARPKRLAILSFPSMAKLKAFYHSAEYQALIPNRKRAARSSFIAIEGI